MTDEAFYRASEIQKEKENYEDALCYLTAANENIIRFGTSVTTFHLNGSLKDGLKRLLQNEIDRLQKEFDAL